MLDSCPGWLDSCSGDILHCGFILLCSTDFKKSLTAFCLMTTVVTSYVEHYTLKFLFFFFCDTHCKGNIAFE